MEPSHYYLFICDSHLSCADEGRLPAGPDYLRQGCGGHSQRSYSDHDTQKCGAGGTNRNDSDDGSFSMGVRLQPGKFPARLSSCGNGGFVIHLRGWLLQRDGVLLRIPQSAEVMILARTALGEGPSETDLERSAERNGRHVGTRTPDLYRVKVAL